MNSLKILLYEGDEGMKGVIRPKNRCSRCGGKFEKISRLGFICPKCKILPRRFYIDLHWNGERIRLFSDRTGQALDSYERAKILLSHINTEIKNFIFDPSKYVRSEIERFWVSNLIDKFVESKIYTLAPSYQKDYERMGRIVKEFFGIKDARELRKLDIVNFKEHLEKNFEFRPKTIKNIMDFLKTFLRYLKFDLEIIDNIPPFPKIEVQPHQFKWLLPEEQIKILECIPEDDRPIVAFLMLQGCRPGEARALKCKNVNLREMTITISASFSREVYREKRKGRGAKPVLIPIHPEMVDFLRERVLYNLPEAFVFVDPKTGKPYTENGLRRIWDYVKKKVGFSSLRFYDATRHSFASQLVNAGTSLFTVSKLMGHSTMKTTERYAHPQIEALRTDLKKLSLAVTKLSPNQKCLKIN